MPKEPCLSGKVKYRDELAAKLAAERLMRGFAPRLRVYRCPYCLFYHHSKVK